MLRNVSSDSAAGSTTAEHALLAALGIEAGGHRHGELAAACAPIARRIRDGRLRAVGFIPADDRAAVPPLLIQLGLSLCELTGATIAVVDANVRYPGLPTIAKDQPTLHKESVFSTRWLGDSLALLSPPRLERAGDVLPQLARALAEGSDLFAHVLVDLTGFELLGEHTAAASFMDACAIVARAHETRESSIGALAQLLPSERFLGVVLVG